MSLILAKEFTNLEGAISFSAIDFIAAGSSASAVNADHDVLSAWIVTSSGVKRVAGRVDGRGHSDDSVAATALLGTNGDAEGVRCCYNPVTNGWIIVYNVGTTVYYRLFSNTLSPASSDTALPSTMPAGSGSSSFNLGCDENGFFSVSWPGRIIRINSANATVVSNVPIAGGDRMHVHVASGNIDVTRISGSNLVVDRYLPEIVQRDTVIAATDSNLVSGLHSITSRYSGEGFTVAWIANAAGDNVKYRTFSSDGIALYATQTISGTGSIDVSSSQGRLSLCIGERPLVDDQNHTFAIRATSTNASGGRIIALIEPERFNPQTINKTEYMSISDSGGRYGQPVVCTSPYEMRLMRPNSGLNSMSLEAYLRQSVLTGVWRIEKNARVFSNSFDQDSATFVNAIYSQYPGGNKLIGNTGTNDADYTGSTGRSGVNPDVTSYAAYWGSADEENVFIGGPEQSEIAMSFEDNPNMFDPQITTLASELGFSTFQFFYANRNNGWGIGDDAPEIRVTVGGTEYILQRHVDPQNSERIVDYGVIIRLPSAATDTQSTKSHVYLAGINSMSTEAAAYAYSNFIPEHIGSSLGILVVAKYSSALHYGNSYDPSTHGTIHCYPLSAIDSDDFEGIR